MYWILPSFVRATTATRQTDKQEDITSWCFTRNFARHLYRLWRPISGRYIISCDYTRYWTMGCKMCNNCCRSNGWRVWMWPEWLWRIVEMTSWKRHGWYTVCEWVMKPSQRYGTLVVIKLLVVVNCSSSSAVTSLSTDIIMMRCTTSHWVGDKLLCLMS